MYDWTSAKAYFMYRRKRLPGAPCEKSNKSIAANTLLLTCNGLGYVFAPYSPKPVISESVRFASVMSSGSPRYLW